MANVIVISEETKEKILNDFLKGGDNRISVLAEKYDVSHHFVHRVIDKYFKK